MAPLNLRPGATEYADLQALPLIHPCLLIQTTNAHLISDLLCH